MAYQIKRYGWKPDHPDHRDFKFAAKPRVLKALPPKLDLRPSCPQIFNQLTLGSCTAQAIGFDCMFMEMKMHPEKAIMPSRLFIYYNERVIEGTVHVDAGAELRDGMKAINTWGYPDESLWPYDITKFTSKPSQKVYAAALKEIISEYSRVGQTSDQLRGCLVEGFPIVFGFTVYESFESEEVAHTGIVPMPLHAEAAIGGHAVALVGYDDEKQMFTVRNSWGPDWGDHGYCYMPYSYILDPDLSADFWTVRAA